MSYDDGRKPHGLQIETVRTLMLAWALTMPVSMVLAGSLFWLFNKLG